MGVKRKLIKFAALETFQNVIQAPQKEFYTQDHNFKGKWHAHVFKNENPIVLELGCGKGEYTIGLAQHDLNKNFIGIDLKGARIYTGAKQALDRSLQNVRFLRTRIDFIESFFAAGEVSEIWIPFPDPQPQEPRARKRLTSLPFLQKYARICRSNAQIHLKTDNPGLYEFTLDVLQNNKYPILSHSPQVYQDSQELPWGVREIQTHYEALFSAKGFPIHNINFRLG